MSSPPKPPKPPTEDELAALVGHRFPGGRALAEPYLDWLVRDALGAPQRTPGVGTAHPAVAFGMAQGGVGLELEDVFTLFGASSADGPMLGEWSLRLHRPLRTGTAYAVAARVEHVRRTRGRSGVFDLVTPRIELIPDGPGESGAVEVEVRPTYVFPRRDPGSAPDDGAGSGRPVDAGRAGDPGAGRAGSAEDPVGESLPELSLEVRPEPMKVMAAILRDPNMIHLEPAETARLGMGERVVNQGPLNLGYVLTMLAGFAGGVDRVRAATFRFLGPVHAGDRVTAGGVVTGAGPDRVECAVWLDVTGGGARVHRVVSGTAVLERRDGLASDRSS